MFSDDLDKALATFVLANGAAATGQKVTIFFTFWGLNVIKKLHKPETEKDIFGKMFGMMLPSSSKKLKLSKMSMGGMGGKMMRYIMNKKGIDSLESSEQQFFEQFLRGFPGHCMIRMPAGNPRCRFLKHAKKLMRCEGWL